MMAAKASAFAVGGIVLLVVTLVLVMQGTEKGSLQLPTISLAEAEPQVAEKTTRLRQAVTENPESPREWSRLARTYHAHHMYEAAIICYTQTMELAPQDYRWPYLSALAQRRIDLSSSLPAFKRAEQLNPDNAAFFINYADTLVRLDQIEAARQQYLRATAVDARATHALYGLAQLAVMENSPDQAIDFLEQATAIAHYHGEVHQLLAQLYQRRGDFERAALEEELAGYYSVVTRTPDPVVQAMESEAIDTESYASRGVRLARQHKYREAEYQFRKVLELRLGRPQDYTNLGAALTGLNRLDEALGYYEKALAVDPQHTDSLNNAGIAYTRKNQFDRAAGYFVRITVSDPADADAWHNLGLVRQSQGRVDEAIGAYREALQRQPAHAETLTNLGQALYDRGQVDAAMGYWRRAVAINPANLPALVNLSTGLTLEGNYQEAIKWLRLGTELLPDSRNLRYRLAWQLATAPVADVREPTTALNIARSLFEDAPGEARYADLAAIAFAGMGDFERAANLSRRAVRQAVRAGDEALARQIGYREQLFRAGRPYVQPAASAADVMQENASGN